MDVLKVEMNICLGSSCFSRGSGRVLEVLNNYIKENKLDDRVDFRGSLCSGNCKNGPILKIAGKLYDHVSEESVIHILNSVFAESL